MRYLVKSPVYHGDERGQRLYDVGETIELSEAQAAPLLEQSIEPAPAAPMPEEKPKGKGK